MSTQQLKGLLEIMERMGHVEKVTDDNYKLSSVPIPAKTVVVVVQEKSLSQAGQFTG